MKKIIIAALAAAALFGCKSASTSYVTYEFDTFDGRHITIDETNICSQEPVDSALECTQVPDSAVIIAPGRDYSYFEDADHIYIQDAANGLLTIANK